MQLRMGSCIPYPSRPCLPAVQSVDIPSLQRRGTSCSLVQGTEQIRVSDNGATTSLWYIGVIPRLCSVWMYNRKRSNGTDVCDEAQA